SSGRDPHRVRTKPGHREAVDRGVVGVREGLGLVRRPRGAGRTSRGTTGVSERPDAGVEGAALPTGTVTFLFTDIEGSTKLVQRLGEAYPDVLAEHHQILLAAIERSGGVRVGTEGDSVFAAFATAPAALSAAVEAQNELGV